MGQKQFFTRIKSALRSGQALRRLFDFVIGNLLYTSPKNFRKSLFSGKSYYCPICNSKLRSFLNLYRPYHLWCPVCKSLQRHRLAWIYLNSEDIQISSRELRFLHFAPEPGLSTRFQSIPSLDYVTADLYDPAAVLKMDVSDIKLPTDTIDLIYCSHVLEHVADDLLAMREFYRVLRYQGKAIIQVPISGETTFEDISITDPIEREKHFGQIDHVRIYGKDIIDRLSKAGFSVRVYETEDLVVANDIGRMGLNPGERIYLCQK